MRHGMQVLAALFLLLVVIPAPAHAQLTLERVVIGQGGGQMSNGSLVMNLTIGEPITGSASSGALTVNFGYWWSVLVTTAGVQDAPQGVAYAFGRNAPNPFTTRTQISYVIPAGQRVPVFIGVYDVRGALVRTLVRETQGAGTFSVAWDGRSDRGDMPSAGIYFATINAGPFRQTRRLVMVK